MSRRLATLGTTIMVAWASLTAAQTEWTPEKWIDADTLQLCTTGPTEGRYCFPVWLVVIDGDVYVRLGTKAAERVHANTSGTILPVEVDGQRFDNVRAIEVPDYAQRVSDAMAGKYTSDMIMRFFSHPLTLRLRPESAPGDGAAASPPRPASFHLIAYVRVTNTSAANCRPGPTASDNDRRRS